MIPLILRQRHSRLTGSFSIGVTDLGYPLTFSHANEKEGAAPSGVGG
jgi:hypothetical protein